MRSAVIILALVTVVVAEAPYHLPRPAPHAPLFGYPSGPLPAPLPQLPVPRPVPQPFVPISYPAPAPTHGYNYQQPNFGPAFIHPASQPIPAYHPPPPFNFPAPQPLPILHPQPIPINYPQSQPVNYPQPQPLPVSYPRPQPIPIPRPSYGLPQTQPQPQPQPFPNFFYSAPQGPFASAPSTFSQTQNLGYVQPISQPQSVAPFPLQSQQLTNNAVTSYQADSNQYAAAQATHSEALDETVVSHIQNIIRDNEHSVAKNAGYLSLVSGVSLENAKPSIEVSSFVHNSPQSGNGLIDIRSGARGATQLLSAGAGSFSSGYETPTFSSGSSQSSDNSASVLTSNKPGISYGVPN